MKKIKHALPEPCSCDNCNSLNVNFVKNNVVYGKLYGDWPYCWFCSDCKALVGCHPQTRIPLGLMADSFTRKLRKLAHDEFDKIWQEGFLKRTQAYIWLANELGISHDICHMSWLKRHQLEEVRIKSRDYLSINRNKLRLPTKQEKLQIERDTIEYRKQCERAAGQIRRRKERY